MTRTATIERRTGETDITVALTLDGTGNGSRETGVGFLDHMLDLLARHGRLDLSVTANGDLQTGAHHTVEDVGICIGQALDIALGDRAGIFRYGHAIIPMDEARRHLPLRARDHPDGRGARDLCDRHLRSRPARVRGRASAWSDRQLRPRTHRRV